MNAIKTTIIDNLEIFYSSALNDFEESVLLLSPLPESIRAFEPIWDTLTSQYNVIAIDLPGFGRSEARSDLFAPIAMAKFVVKAIDHFNCGPMHIVGPDIGSSVALFIAQYHPEKIKSAIIGSAACVFPIQSDGILTNMIMDPTNEGLQIYSSRDIISGALANMSKYQLSDEVKEEYLSSYDNGRFWDTMLFLKALLVDLPLLNLENIAIPTLIIWGDKDPLAILKNGEILHDKLPSNELVILDAGHYVWEDAHAEYSDYLQNWINAGYKSF